MKCKMTLVSAMTFGLLAGTDLGADVWDRGPVTDNGPTTPNELVHGSDQVHDLAAVGDALDNDWYRVVQQPYSSYEIVVDPTSGDIGSGLEVDLVDSLGVKVYASALPVSADIGFGKTLRVENRTASALTNRYLRIRSPSCGTTCSSGDEYRIRLYDTTCAFARFNNSGSQFTVLQLQNPSSHPIRGRFYFWSAAGALLGTTDLLTTGVAGSTALAAKGLYVLNTADLPFGAGQSGSITLSHDGRNADLNGKAVAIEPATGFSFDTVMTRWPD